MNEGFNPYENEGNAVPSGVYKGPQNPHQGGPSSGSGGSGAPNYRNNGGSDYRASSGGSYSGGNRSNGGGFNNGGRSYGNNGGYNNNRSFGGAPKSYGGNQGKPAFQKRTYTEEDLRNTKPPMAVVISGSEQLNDQGALVVARLTKAFEDKGFTIRTGGLSGVDDVVINSAQNPELHLPFKGFNKHEAASSFSNEPCTELAKRHKPDLDSLNKIQKAILAKNPRLVFGRYLTAPAQIVIIWSEDGSENYHELARSGNAGHIARIAISSGIRVINLQRPDGEQRALAYLESLNVQQAQQQNQSNYQGGNPTTGNYQGGNPTTGNYQGGNHPSSGSDERRTGNYPGANQSGTHQGGSNDFSY